MKKKSLVISIALLWMSITVNQAQTMLVQYAITQSQLSPENTINTTQFTAGNLTRGGIFSGEPGTPCAAGLSNANSSTSGTGSISFTLTPQTGYKIDLTELNCGLRRTPNGGQNFQASYSISTGGSGSSGSIAVPQVTCRTSSNNAGDWDFSDFTVNAGSSVTFTLSFTTFSGNNANTQLYQLEVWGTVSCATPTQSSAIGGDTPGFTSLSNLAWTSGNGGNRLVVVSQTNPVSFVPVNGTTYSTGINSNFSLAADLGSNNKIVYSGSGNSLASLSGLTSGTCYFVRIYDFNCSGADITYNTSTATGNPYSFCTASSNDALSDIIETPSYSYLSNLDYATYQSAGPLTTGNSQGVGSFRIRDGGSGGDSDVTTTTLSSISFSTGSSTAVRRAAIFQGSTNLGEIAVNGSTTLSFSGLSIQASDNGTADLELRVSWQGVVTDNQQITFSITGATANGAGSVFSSPNAGGAATSSTGDRNRLEVTASRLRFVQQPSTVRPTESMIPAVSVEATDALLNRDLDFNTGIRITSSGSLSGTPVEVTASNGLATFSGLTHTATGSNLTLSARRTISLDWTEASSTFNINTTTQATDYFRSLGTGTWSTAGTWQSSWDSSTWVTSTLVPNSDAKEIRIRNGHAITLNSSITIDQCIIEAGSTLNRTGGTLTLNNGAGTDLTINGHYFHDANMTKPEGTGTILVGTGGILEVNNNSNTPHGYANNADGYEDRIDWANGSVFYWNLSSIPSSSNITYFPAQPTNEIPEFRIGTGSFTFGAGAQTTINGRLSIDAGRTITFQNAGVKYIRNGITGSGNVTQAGSSGEINISGVAELSGTGTITVSTGGMRIASGSSTTLMSNKVIDGGGNRITNSGTLDAQSFQLQGLATFRNEGVFVTTKEAGFNGTTQTAIHSGMGLDDCQPGSRVILAATGNQNLTATQYHHVEYTGSGTLTLASTGTIEVSGDFLPGSGPFVTTGSTVEFNGASAQTISEPFVFNNLIINNTSVPSTSAVTIQSGVGHLQEVKNTLTPTQGSLITNGNLRLLSTASQTANVLKQITPTGVITGDVQVQRYIGSSGGYRLISSPVIGDSSDTWYQGGRMVDGYWYQENLLGPRNTGWRSFGGNEPLVTGRGYFGSFASGASTFTLNGTVNAGTINFSDISWTVDPLNRSASGWCIAGNPYPCTIDWNAALGWSRTNISTTLFYQDPATGQNASYNNGVGTLGATRYIPSGQAFWIKAYGTNPTMSCTEDVKVNQQPVFYRNAQTEQDLIRLILKNESKAEDIVLRFHPEATAAVDDNFEAEIPPFISGAKELNLSFPQEESEYAILARNSSDKELGFNIPLNLTTGNFENSLLQAIAEPSLLNRLYLKELNSDNEFPLSQELSMPISELNSYRLILKPESNKNLLSQEIKLWPNPGKGNLSLHLPESFRRQTLNVSWIDLQGKVLSTETYLASDSYLEINTGDLPGGIYFLEVESKEGKTVIRQVIR